MKDFKSWLSLNETIEASLLDAIKSGDYVAFLAYLDNLEEAGKPIPPELAQWRTLPTLNKIHIRWMIRRDLPEIIAIDQFGTNDPYSEDDFYKNLSDRHTIGMVAENGSSTDGSISDERILGYVIYRLYGSSISIIRLAVHPLIRKQGIGAAIINQLKTKISPERRSAINFTNHPKEIGGFLKNHQFQNIDSTNSFYQI